MSLETPISPRRIHNFNAGPSVLPDTVLQQAADAVRDFQGTGISLLSYGHRTPLFTSVMDEACALVKEIMELGDDHEVLFLHGGASTQFMQVPMNLLDDKETAAYADTGVWSAKAIKEAKLFGRVDVACSSAEQNYRYIPNDFAIPNDARYFHITTNNTIYGTQWQNIPRISNPLVADMSSDIFSRARDFKQFALIYAGAQKNLGAAGVTLVVVNKNILGKVKRNIPTILDYRNHIREKSMLNTPPVFAVYVSLLTMRWIKQEGGLPEMERRNKEKADTLYKEIDENPLFRGTVVTADRSRTNCCFVMEDPSLESQFLQYTAALGITGIKGHRSVGGFRASLYNGLPMDSVDTLISAMRDFSNAHK